MNLTKEEFTQVVTKRAQTGYQKAGGSDMFFSKAKKPTRLRSRKNMLRNNRLNQIRYDKEEHDDLLQMLQDPLDDLKTRDALSRNLPGRTSR